MTHSTDSETQDPHGRRKDWRRDQQKDSGQNRKINRILGRISVSIVVSLEFLPTLLGNAFWRISARFPFLRSRMHIEAKTRQLSGCH
jgi:hypothetical protein